MSNTQKLEGLVGKLHRGNKGRVNRRHIQFKIDKRQKFVYATLILSLGLFFSEFQYGRSGILAAIILPLFTCVLLFWAVHRDIAFRDSAKIYILPFLYSLSFALFYFLTPTEFVSKLILSSIYGFGLYSLFLSQNIFIVSSYRTITLLSGARIVSFVITLISFFFLSNIAFTLHVLIFPIIVLMFIYTFLLSFHSLWTYTLQKNTQPLAPWVMILTVCVIEAATMLWFWPTSPTVIALFLTGFLYAIVGLSHIWFERRLFKGILWEYVWVGCIVFFILLLFTSWGT